MDTPQGEPLQELRRLWMNFENEDCDEEKKRWILLFLYTYQLLDSEVLKSESFFKDVPTKLCSFMLELVYGIIKDAVTAAQPELDSSYSESNEQLNKSALIAKLLEENCRLTDNSDELTKLTVSAPSDITAIISLRKFLTDGLGHHFLDFLLTCDIETITSKRNLVTLLINLFPNSPWEKNDKDYVLKETVLLDKFCNSVYLLDQCTYESTLDEVSQFTQIRKINKSPDASPIPENLECANEKPIVAISETDFELFKSKQKTSDEIAEVILDLLGNFVRKEKNIILNENSTTVETLRFATEIFSNIEQSNAFDETKKIILRLKVLSLIVLCINNLFSHQGNLLLCDLKNVIEKMFTYLKNCDKTDWNTNQTDTSYRCLFVAVGIVYNMFILRPRKFEDIEHFLKTFNEDKIRLVVNLLVKTQEEFQVKHEHYFESLFRLIFILLSKLGESRLNALRKKQKRQIDYLTENEIHCKGKSLSCFLEEILLKSITCTTTQLQTITIGYFHKNRPCCCLSTLNNMTLLLACPYNTQIEKSVYKFICLPFLRNVLLRNSCEHCRRKALSLHLHEHLFQLYKQKYLNISDPGKIRIYLKHLITAGRLFPTEILSRILREIIFPIFRNEKQKKKDERKISILLDSLNVVIIYLNDTRLIKAVYNEENLKDIEEILYMPELCRAACDLIRIGIDSVSNLGIDDSGFMVQLSEHLTRLLLNAGEKISKELNYLFAILKTDEEISEIDKIIKTEQIGETNYFHRHGLTISEIFHLANIFWSAIFEMYSSNNRFRECFQQKYLMEADNSQDSLGNATNCNLFCLICNTLTTFLRQYPQENSTNRISMSHVVSTSSDSFFAGYAGGKTSPDTSVVPPQDEEVLVHRYLEYHVNTECGEWTENSVDIPYSLSYDRRDKIFTDDSSTYTSFVEIILKSYPADGESLQSDFLGKLKSNDNYIIFDIKNQNTSASYYKTDCEGGERNGILTDGLRKINSILSSSFTYFFGATNLKSESNEYDTVQSDILDSLRSIGCRKSLIEIFEFTLCIFIMDNWEKSDTSNFLYLTKLKEAILCCSKRIKGNNTSAVIQALQSLLKVAELANRSKISINKNGEESLDEHAGNISLNSDADYYSSKMSCSFLDSETEISENDTEECYITADEGYQADAELPDISELDDELKDIWQNYIPSSQYRAVIVHEGICKIVIEILMELSMRCIQDPPQWASSLSQLTNGLYVIREFLGGPLFLLKGFASVLKTNDSRLREFQQSIVDLITHFNSPETLLAFYEILGSDNCPVDILIKHLYYACISNLQFTPSAELIFPGQSEEYVSATDSSYVCEQIKQVRNCHKSHNLKTPFTKASGIIPLVANKLWHEGGFTASLWLQIKDCIFSNPSNRHNRCSQRSMKKIHLISFGSSQVLLSVYITDELFLTFEISTPNRETNSPKEPMKTFEARKSKDPKPQQQQSFCMLRRRKRITKKLSKVPQINEEETDNETALSERQVPTTSEKIASAMHNTKQAIINSLHNFQLFPTVPFTVVEDCEESSVLLKYLRLSKRKWMHLCFAISTGPKALEITVTVNGVEQNVISLPCNINQLAKFDKFQAICLGHARTPAEEEFLQYSLSNLMFFHKNLSNKSVLANLTALGPDCTNLTHCQIGNNYPNYGLFNFGKTFNLKISDFGDSMRQLKESLIISYSAHEPWHVTQFEKDTNGSTLGFISGLVIFDAKLTVNRIPSVQTAVFLTGGLSSVLYLFARVAELSSDPDIQATALDALLCIARYDCGLYTEFVKQNYLDMIGYVIRTDQCSKDITLLKSIVNNACTQPVISKRNDVLQVMENTTACVIYPNFIVSVIKRYSDWCRPCSKESKVLDMLLQSIRALIRDRHPHQNFNINQLVEAGLIREMLNLCKIYVIESPNPVYISEVAAMSYVSILNTLAGSPPPPSLLDEIMKLLLLLQKPSECFVTHDRSKLYFLVNPDPPIKHKKIGLSLPTKHMRQILRERKRTNSTHEQAFESKSTITEQVVPEKSHKSGISALKSVRNQKKSSEIKVNNVLQIDNFENLKDIANCSRLDEKSINLLKSGKAINFKSICTRRSRGKVFQFQRDNKIGTISRKRIRSASLTHSESDIEKKRKVLLEDDASNDYFISGEYDIVNSDELSDLEEPPQGRAKKFIFMSKRDFYELPGIIKMQEGLFMLLKDSLLILPDGSVDEVLTHYIKLDILIILSNNKNCGIRASIVKLISALCDRLPTNDVHNFTKKFYWHHLANQLSLNPVDSYLVEACIQWITGTYHNLEGLLRCSHLQAAKKYGLNSLIAFLPQTLRSNTLCVNTFQIVEKLYTGDISCCAYFHENGLIQSSVKTLYRLFIKQKAANCTVEAAITNVLAAIAKKSIKSSGNISIFWEVLNLLSFNQRSDISSIISGFRSVEANILLRSLELFVTKESASSSTNKFQNLRLPDSFLSPTELRTRFDLVIDRSLQLLISSKSSYQPTTNEETLFGLLISIGLTGNSKCSNLLIWGLLPMRNVSYQNIAIKTFWRACRDESIPATLNDLKMIKSLLGLHLVETSKRSSDENQPSPLENLCEKLNITKTNMPTVDIDSDKIDLNNEHHMSKKKNATEKALYKYEPLAQSCIESSMLITRIVTELQNSERKALIHQMKEYDENYIYEKWTSIVQRMTHEGAPWFNEKLYPKSWELDDTEGPFRIRVRLRRCHLNIDRRFLMTEPEDAEGQNKLPLAYLLAGHEHHLSFSKNAQVLFNFPAVYLPVDGEIDGELLITDEKMYFVATYRYRFYCISYEIDSITDIWLRRYQHQDNAFEIFLDTNQSKFFVLKNRIDFKTIKEIFADKIIQFPEQSKLYVITQQWRDGQLTNWEYLMTLNQLAGRTYNDLMQYPVFPWVLANFESDNLDLKDPKNFRKLAKPIAVQHEENEPHYINNYSYISNTMTNLGELPMKPYHYSSHYSNSGTVLHFLVRVPPFTGFFLRYQDNNFDLPDRTFHSINTTWRLASRDSPTDVKELIPEFYCLPEMLENFGGFNFGARQSGEVVDDVILPPWCSHNARLFVLIHRQALESEIVRNNLNSWIDLIFGCKQSGAQAVEAINVFHPATYAEFHMYNIADPIERKAVETMVRTYGQMPRQLFKLAHPPSKQIWNHFCNLKVLQTVDGLRWGIFTGSPDLPEPELNSRQTLSAAIFTSLVSFTRTNVIYGVPEKCCVMQGPENDVYLLVSWSHEDRVVRLQSLSGTNTLSKPLFYNSPLDEITCCGSDVNTNSLWFGHKSGRISVYRCYKVHKTNKSRQNHAGIKLSYNSAFRIIPNKFTQKSEESHNGDKNGGGFNESNYRWMAPVILTCHTDEVTSIALSSEFKIAVSVGKDGLAVIWDTNSFSYIRTIQKPSEIHNLPISLVTISPTLGDIITIHTMDKQVRYGSNDDECFEVTEDSFDGFVNVSMSLTGKSMMRLHSINAKYIERVVSVEKIISVCYSYVREGVGVNIVATAMESGVIKLWSSWNLAFVREIELNNQILSLTYSAYQHLVVLTKDNIIEVWLSEGLPGKPPLFPQISFN